MSSVNSGREPASAFSGEESRIAQGRVGANLTVFMIATLLAFSMTTREPPAPAQFEQKLELLDSRKGIDAVFMGSSRTHFQVIPQVFDQEAGRRGLGIRSFNLGLVGAFGHEIDYLLEKHVLRHADLRFAFIEVRGFEYQCPDQRERTFREIHWHDAKRTLESVATTLQSSLGALRWAEVQDHLLHFGLRFIGRWPARRGVVDVTDSRGYTEWIYGHGRDADAPRHTEEAAYPGNLVLNRAALLRQQSELVARGIKVFYVLPPGAPRFREFDRMEAEGELMHVIRLNDPDRYPELFTAEARGTQYLLREGAARYSRLLAGAVAEAIRKAPASEP